MQIWLKTVFWCIYSILVRWIPINSEGSPRIDRERVGVLLTWSSKLMREKIGAVKGRGALHFYKQQHLQIYRGSFVIQLPTLTCLHHGKLWKTNLYLPLLVYQEPLSHSPLSLINVAQKTDCYNNRGQFNLFTFFIHIWYWVPVNSISFFGWVSKFFYITTLFSLLDCLLFFCNLYYHYLTLSMPWHP